MERNCEESHKEWCCAMTAVNFFKTKIFSLADRPLRKVCGAPPLTGTTVHGQKLKLGQKYPGERVSCFSWGDLQLSVQGPRVLVTLCWAWGWCLVKLELTSAECRVLGKQRGHAAKPRSKGESLKPSWSQVWPPGRHSSAYQQPSPRSRLCLV